MSCELLNLPFRANFQNKTGLSRRYDDEIPFDRFTGLKVKRVEWVKRVKE